MFGNVEQYTYVFKSAYENAYSRENDGKLERDEDEKHYRYDKEDVIAVVENAIKKGTIKKGIKVDREKSRCVTYRYTCEAKDKNGQKKKFVHRIQIDKNYLDENLDYINRLEALIITSNKVSRVNFSNKVIQGATCALAATVLTVTIGASFLYGLEKKFEIQDANNRSYVEQMNEARRENNQDPFVATYEDGTPFEGSYIDWAKYQS